MADHLAVDEEISERVERAAGASEEVKASETVVIPSGVKRSEAESRDPVELR